MKITKHGIAMMMKKTQNPFTSFQVILLQVRRKEKAYRKKKHYFGFLYSSQIVTPTQCVASEPKLSTLLFIKKVLFLKKKKKKKKKKPPENKKLKEDDMR